jgi:hypothetical protein
VLEHLLKLNSVSRTCAAELQEEIKISMRLAQQQQQHQLQHRHQSEPGSKARCVSSGVDVPRGAGKVCAGARGDGCETGGIKRFLGKRGEGGMEESGNGGCVKTRGVSHAAVEEQRDSKRTKFGHAASGIVRFFLKKE